MDEISMFKVLRPAPSAAAEELSLLVGGRLDDALAQAPDAGPGAAPARPGPGPAQKRPGPSRLERFEAIALGQSEVVSRIDRRFTGGSEMNEAENEHRSIG